jgi:hypothetical protein
MSMEGKYCQCKKRVTGKSEVGWIWSMYLIDLYENRAMKPVEIVFKRGGGGWEQVMEGLSLTTVSMRIYWLDTMKSPAQTIKAHKIVYRLFIK